MIEIDDPIEVINLPLILGDKTGFLHIQDRDTFFVEFAEYETIRSSPPTNFIVREGGELWVSQDFRVIGQHDPAVQLDGHLSGVFNLTVSHTRHFSVGMNATNARFMGGQHDAPTPGKSDHQSFKYPMLF